MVLVCLLTVFFSPLSLSLSFLTFLLVLCGVGDDLGAFQKFGLLTCMECLGLWFKGFWGRGDRVNSMHCHVLLHVCGRRGGAGGRGGKIQLQSCQNMIKPKHKDCGASHLLVLSPETHFLP